ncbi:hypothetical protein L207DRAFT_92699 [Hyaloscypha variabilis F]|uniref:Uncharacterized protein n=1 Tax=Hyaloscypha variabilis (strain UAMH 11265 / GT02V1 / F) TaxID=1149755 RepID=A0A2J6RER1_HYAVF|nr:hypothetical protein L207DRAFT_92699 [Hyaloscypha variabilis F]
MELLAGTHLNDEAQPFLRVAETQEGLDSKGIRIQCLTQDNNCLRDQREGLIRQVKDLKAQVHRQHLQNLLADHARVEARRAGIPLEKQYMNQLANQWECIEELKQQLGERPDEKLKRELNEAVIEMEEWREDSRASRIERDEMLQLLRIQQKDTECLRLSDLELLKKVRSLEEENESLVVTYADLTMDLARERMRCEGVESRLDELHCENAELWQTISDNVCEIGGRMEAVAEQEALRDALNAKLTETERHEKDIIELNAKKAELSQRVEQIEKDTSQKISDLEYRIKLLEIVADYARHLRSRIFHTGLGGKTNRVFIKAGNEAAHSGNIVVDIILFSFGFLDEGEKNFCEAKYAVSPEFSIDTFVKNDEMLQALMESKWTKVLNMHAYIDSECKSTISEDLEQSLARFRVLEAECLQRYEGWGSWASEDQALRSFWDEYIEGKLREMERIVRCFQEAKREKDTRPR